MKESKRKPGPKPLQQLRPEPTEIAPAGGRLGVLLAGMGAVATTFATASGGSPCFVEARAWAVTACMSPR